MGKYKKILVAFDGSVSGRNALKQAIRLSEAEKCWIKVLAVMPSYEGELNLTGVQNIKKVMKGPVERILAEARSVADAEKAVIITNVEQGEAYEKIVAVADAENCELIVLGRRGIHRIERVLMGSVASRVIGYSGNDVLVVPRDTEIGWKNVLLATDGSSYSDYATVRAIDFATSYSGRLSVVSVVDINDEFNALAPAAAEKMIGKAKKHLEAARQKADTAGLKADTVVKEGEPYSKIVEFADEINADVIFVGSHGRAGFKKLLMGSVTEKVIGFAGCPVMVVKS
jgi:nucleotide-binding universal stress UspA family protein